MAQIEINDSRINTGIPSYIVLNKNNEADRLGIYETGSGEYTFVKVRAVSISEDYGEINYFNIEDELIAKVIVDGINQKFTFYKENGMNMRLACGQATADCIEEVYTDWGWWSVGAIVGSILNPGVGVGIAGLCALEMCAGDGKV